MSNVNEQTAAITNRSLRTIRTELEFLCDSSIITPQQLASLLGQLPNQTILHAPLSSPATTPGPNVPSSFVSPPVNTMVNQLANSSLNEKQNNFYASTPSPALPPPAYTNPNGVATASALYEYHPSDAGDLAILTNDRILITEFMNADWAKGRNERTGMEGIFPRSYVSIIDEKGNKHSQQPPPVPTQSSYGNMPLDVSQQGAGPSMGAPQKPNKFNENGKKFGKKMGNAAIFGAGATIGSNIVNGIF